MTVAWNPHCIVDLSSDSDEDSGTLSCLSSHPSTSGRKRVADSKKPEGDSVLQSKHVRLVDRNGWDRLSLHLSNQNLSGKDTIELSRFQDGTIKTSTSITPSELGKPVEAPMNEVDSDDDCCILEVDPDKAENKDEAKVDDDEDLIVTKATGPVACRDFPHARHSCATYPFDKTPHSTFCGQCHCFVCDTPVPTCKLWGDGARTEDHCHANDRDQKWTLQRKCLKGGRPPCDAAAAAPAAAFRNTAFPYDSLPLPFLRPLVSTGLYDLPSVQECRGATVPSAIGGATHVAGYGQAARVAGHLGRVASLRGEDAAASDPWQVHPASIAVSQNDSLVRTLWNATMGTRIPSPPPAAEICPSISGIVDLDIMSPIQGTVPPLQQSLTYGCPRTGTSLNSLTRGGSSLQLQPAPVTPVACGRSAASMPWLQGQRNEFLDARLAEASEGAVGLFRPASSNPTSSSALFNDLYPALRPSSSTSGIVRGEGQRESMLASALYNHSLLSAEEHLLRFLPSGAGQQQRQQGGGVVQASAPSSRHMDIELARFGSSGNGSRVVRAEAGDPAASANLCFGGGHGSGVYNSVIGIDPSLMLTGQQHQQLQQLSYQPSILVQQAIGTTSLLQQPGGGGGAILYQPPPQQAVTPNLPAPNLTYPAPNLLGLPQQQQQQSPNLTAYSLHPLNGIPQNMLGGGGGQLGFTNPATMETISLLGNISFPPKYQDSTNSANRSTPAPTDVNSNQLSSSQPIPLSFQTHIASPSTGSLSTAPSTPLTSGEVQSPNPNTPRLATPSNISSSTAVRAAAGHLPSAYSSMAFGSPVTTPTTWHHGSSQTSAHAPLPGGAGTTGSAAHGLATFPDRATASTSSSAPQQRMSFASSQGVAAADPTLTFLGVPMNNPASGSLAFAQNNGMAGGSIVWPAGLDSNCFARRATGSSRQGRVPTAGHASPLGTAQGSSLSPATTLMTVPGYALQQPLSAALGMNPISLLHSTRSPGSSDVVSMSSALPASQALSNQPLGSLSQSHLTFHLSPTAPQQSAHLSSYASAHSGGFPTFGATDGPPSSSIGQTSAPSSLPSPTQLSSQDGSLGDWDLGLDSWCTTSLPQELPLLPISPNALNHTQSFLPVPLSSELPEPSPLGRRADRWNLNAPTNSPVGSLDAVLAHDRNVDNNAVAGETRQSLRDVSDTRDGDSRNALEPGNFLGRLGTQPPLSSASPLPGDDAPINGGNLASSEDDRRCRSEQATSSASLETRNQGNARTASQRAFRIVIKGPAPPADGTSSLERVARNGGSGQEGEGCQEAQSFPRLMGVDLNEGRRKRSSPADGLCPEGSSRSGLSRPGKSRRVSLMGEWLEPEGQGGEANEDVDADVVDHSDDEDGMLFGEERGGRGELRWDETGSRSHFAVDSGGGGCQGLGRSPPVEHATNVQGNDGDDDVYGEQFDPGEGADGGGDLTEGDVSPLGGSGVSEDEGVCRAGESPTESAYRKEHAFFKDDMTCDLEIGRGEGEWERATLSPQGSPCGGHVDNELWQDGRGLMEDSLETPPSAGLANPEEIYWPGVWGS